MSGGLPPVRITTLIANHNYGHYLASSIQSAINQTYPHQCICVIDDKSDDNSIDIAKENLFNKEPKVEFYQNIKINTLLVDNRKHVLIELPSKVGPSEARNIGISATLEETEIYAILDADDEMLPNKLSELSPYFKFPEIGIVYADYNIYNVLTGKTRTEYKEPFNLLRLHQECIIHSGSLIAKHALLQTRDQNGFYDRSMRTCEDYDLWIRICRHYIAYHVPKVLTMVRWQPQNSTDTVSKEIWNKNWQRIRDKINANQT